MKSAIVILFLTVGCSYATDLNKCFGNLVTLPWTDAVKATLNTEYYNLDYTGIMATLTSGSAYFTTAQKANVTAWITLHAPTAPILKLMSNLTTTQLTDLKHFTAAQNVSAILQLMVPIVTRKGVFTAQEQTAIQMYFVAQLTGCGISAATATAATHTGRRRRSIFS